MKLLCTSCLLIVVVASVSWANDGNSRILDLPQRVSISVPDGWALANEDQLRAYERTRDVAVGAAAKVAGREARVPFQATKRAGASAVTAMMTILPGEATQIEVARWAGEDGTISNLGKLLGAAQVKGLEAAGVSDAEVGPTDLVQIGGKTALHFSVTFTAPTGQPAVADKYIIYTESRTVVFTFQTGADGYVETSTDRQAMLDGLQVQ